MKMSDGIKTLLLSFIEDNVVVSSWGISNIKVSETSLKFDVNGLKYKGTVLIDSLSTKEYTIRIADSCFKVKNPNNVISILDSEIEKTNNYYLDLQNKLFF